MPPGTDLRVVRAEDVDFAALGRDERGLPVHRLFEGQELHINLNTGFLAERRRLIPHEAVADCLEGRDENGDGRSLLVGGVREKWYGASFDASTRSMPPTDARAELARVACNNLRRFTDTGRFFARALMGFS